MLIIKTLSIILTKQIIVKNDAIYIYILGLHIQLQQPQHRGLVSANHASVLCAAHEYAHDIHEPARLMMQPGDAMRGRGLCETPPLETVAVYSKLQELSGRCFISLFF